MKDFRGEAMVLEQLAWLDDTLTKDVRRKVERLLSSYRSMDAIIKAMESDLPQQPLTQNYNISESQRTEVSADKASKIEMVLLAKEKLEHKKKVKRKLDNIYNSLRKEQQDIWDMRYVDGQYDEDVIYQISISTRKYYREKTSLIRSVAEVFYLL